MAATPLAFESLGTGYIRSIDCIRRVRHVFAMQNESAPLRVTCIFTKSFHKNLHSKNGSPIHSIYFVNCLYTVFGCVNWFNWGKIVFLIFWIKEFVFGKTNYSPFSFLLGPINEQNMREIDFFNVPPKVDFGRYLWKVALYKPENESRVCLNCLIDRWTWHWQLSF